MNQIGYRLYNFSQKSGVVTMHTLLSLSFLIFTMSVSFGADLPPVAVVTNSQQRSSEVTASVRTNGCNMELWRYNKNRPDLQGYWIQHVYAGKKHLLKIEHSATEKERSLHLEQGSGYGFMQIDRDLDGKYEMLVIVSHSDGKLTDVLFMTADGWLRHSTPEEFEARKRIYEANLQAMSDVFKAVEKGLKEAPEESKLR